MTEAELFVDHYLKGFCSYPFAEDRGDGTYVAIVPLGFTNAVVIGKINDTTGYDDRWCYEKGKFAEAAILEWKARDYVGEPEGWHRHPTSGRRRPEGNKDAEYINF